MKTATLAWHCYKYKLFLTWSQMLRLAVEHVDGTQVSSSSTWAWRITQIHGYPWILLSNFYGGTTPFVHHPCLGLLSAQHLVPLCPSTFRTCSLPLRRHQKHINIYQRHVTYILQNFTWWVGKQPRFFVLQVVLLSFHLGSTYTVCLIYINSALGQCHRQ